MDLVDVAVFDFPNDASILESILLAENIPFFLNRQSSSIVYPGSGGILSVAENDRDMVVKIIIDAGFEKYLIE